MMAFADERREYSLSGLDRRDLADDPLVQFRTWYEDMQGAVRGGWLRGIGIALFNLWHAILGRAAADANAMIVATADGSGQPSARTVLLKGLDERGFSFFTNYESRKGRDLAENPRAALVFFWPALERQVIVTGTVTRLPTDESAAYFRTRPRGSQVGAWASRQSSVVESRKHLEQQFADASARFQGAEVPLPPYWGGYVLAPTRIEFWQGRPNRLHDRFAYVRESDRWIVHRLAP
jgi:pyridoxamine 5'-phosphate oxidase